MDSGLKLSAVTVGLGEDAITSYNGGYFRTVEYGFASYNEECKLGR